jgi:PKD repeat protein
VTSNTATVLFTVTRACGSSALRTATIEFGDGSSQSLGNLAGSTATVAHTYAGPSESTPISYTAVVQATDVTGESAAASTTVSVTPKPPITPISVTITDSCATATTSGQRCTFTATATGGGEGTTNAPIQSYTWDFDDSSDDITTSGNTTAHVYTATGTYRVTVTVRTVDGRTATGRTEILVKLP